MAFVSLLKLLRWNISAVRILMIALLYFDPVNIIVIFRKIFTADAIAFN